MSSDLTILLVILSPILFIITAIASWFQPGLRPKTVIAISKLATFSGILIAMLCGIFVYQNGLLETKTIGFMHLGFSMRFDALSALIFTMINLIGFIVFKFSFNYMDGDKRQGVFTGRLAATVASVQLLVLSGNLGLLMLSWVLTSLFLHRLLTFYPERSGAIVAARKKFIAARLSDTFLLVACLLLYNQFGTGNIEVIATGMKNLSFSNIPIMIELSAISIALAAILKSALFPTHGWLVEVMETPTPVSALLHAGLLNAGPFLVARMAFVMNGATYAPVVLIIFGGFTALFASVSYLTQTSVKTALGYSSISHMGFSLLMCGLGVYSAAMLHLVAHSFYKAHAFLSSGSVIDVIKAARVSLPGKKSSPIHLFISIILAAAVFFGLALVWGIDPIAEFSLMLICGVIVMGIALFIAKLLNSSWSLSGLFRAIFLAAVVSTAFFSLEAGMSHLLQAQIPSLSQPSIVVSALIIALLLIFAVVTTIQMTAPMFGKSQRWQKLAIHFRNGLYANVLYDRLVGALYIKSSQTHGSSSHLND